HRVETEFKPAPVLAGDRVEVFFGERLEVVVNVARMVEHHDAHAGSGAEFFHQPGPLGDAIVRNAAAGLNGKNVEVTGRRGDLVADDRREIILHTHAPRRFRVVRQNVVIRGDGQFDPFAGERYHALVHARVALTAEGEGV